MMEAESRPNPLDQVRLTALMERATGRPEIAIGLIDGPVIMAHPDLADARIREVPGGRPGACARASSVACQHGTFVTGILAARRGSPAPGIAPACTLLLRPIFAEGDAGDAGMPSATPEELARAIADCLEAGARILNLSVALAQPWSRGQRELQLALDQAVRRGALVVAAAGNQGTVGGSVITRHPWVIPVAACDRGGRPVGSSNLGRSIGQRGLSAPGESITSLGAQGPPVTLGGTSVAAPFVTGSIALLWSEFPDAPAAEIRGALLRAHGPRRTTVVPPVLDAWSAYTVMTRHPASASPTA
jgi:subtilisin family serine protease